MDLSDWEKLHRAVKHAFDYHWAQNTMNANLHLSEHTIASPLTAELNDAMKRLDLLLKQAKVEETKNV